jgi:hypothetical protein
MMGIIFTGIVVTTSDGRSKVKLAQPSNREWATVIQGVNAPSWAIPPFIILAAQYYLSNWYRECNPTTRLAYCNYQQWLDYQRERPRMDLALRLLYSAPDKGQIPVIDPRQPRKPLLN